ncbi:MAG: leucyl aminopeptidase family protein [Phycisphaerales bacterium]
MFESIALSKSGKPTLLVVAHFKGEKLDKDSAALDPSGALAAAAARAEATGDTGACADAFPDAYSRAIIVGLGDRKTFNASSLRAAGAAVARRIRTIKEPRVQVELTPALASLKAADRVKPDAAGCCFAEGLALAAFPTDEFKGAATPKKNDKLALTLRASDNAFTDGLARGLGLAKAANLTRALSNTPANIATPMFMADQAKRLARLTGMTCDVISGPALEREQLTGLINVGKASENKPCLIRLAYTPNGRASKKGGRSAAKPLVLVGKTICYDTGGLSLKINNGMVGMKRDKDGGCAVLGAMHAIAHVIKPDIPVVALLAAAENSISDEAYRPDDILTFRNGVTVEITNTDAEGRLVLADALCWACDKENPAAIIDIATLTGGVVVALGSTFAGLWCEDDKLRAKVESAADATGERVWRLPMHQEYRDMMKSPIADILNSNPNRKAHPIQGAAFLSYFVKDNIPWCHLDIAGTHAADKESGPFSPGPTGFGARLMAELAGVL